MAEKKEAKTTDKNPLVANTPYDDAFRTLMIDCRDLVIPLVNEAFGEHYKGNETVRFAQDYHFLSKQDGETEKRITDSSFAIISGKKEKKYLYECQSNADNSMLFRIFEYSTQIALEQSFVNQNNLVVKIPKCAILFLRSNNDTTDKMVITIDTPGGTVNFDVIVTKIQQYSLDEIFEKNLLFLIPFYIFTHETRLQEYNEDPKALKELQKDYVIIMEHLDKLHKEGKLSAFNRSAIIEMSNKVVTNLAEKFENVQEGVRSIMGGRVLEYEAKTILNEGRLEQAKETALKMDARGMEIPEIADLVGFSVEDVKEWLGLVTA